jgi:hypothetical protein
MEDGEDNYPGLNLGGIPIVSRPGSADRKRAFQSVPLKLASGHDCPRCGGDVPEPGHKGEWEGARSRTDNETEICSNCGRQEAGENMAGGKCTPQSNWPVKPIFHALPRSGLTWEEMRGFGSAPVMPFPGPKELPDLRLHLLDRWQPGGPFERMVSQRHAIAMRDTPELWSASERFTIHNASLWWVKEDMVHITTAAARTMPDDVTARDVELPAEQKRGLVCFEVPWTGADSVHEDNTVNVHALTWGAVKVDGIPCLSITMYEYFDFTQGLGPRELSAALATGVIGEGITDRELHKGPKSVMDQAVRLRGGAWVLLGRTDWPMKEKVNEFKIFSGQVNLRHLVAGDTKQESMVEDRKFLAAFCMLVNHKLSNVDEENVPRHVRKRADRAGHPMAYPSSVRLVRLRESSAKHESEDGDESKQVEWSHRWMVDGHWAWRACGPKRQQRRLVYVVPYIKGPPEKPLVIKDTVRTWVR